MASSVSLSLTWHCRPILQKYGLFHCRRPHQWVTVCSWTLILWLPVIWLLLFGDCSSHLLSFILKIDSPLSFFLYKNVVASFELVEKNPSPLNAYILLFLSMEVVVKLGVGSSHVDKKQITLKHQISCFLIASFKLAEAMYLQSP